MSYKLDHKKITSKVTRINSAGTQLFVMRKTE
jgi:hypothetical protein